MGRLEGKTAIITGAASGIGLAATKLFASEGASVLGIDLDPERVETALAGSGPKVSCVSADVCEPEQIAQALDLAVERYGGVDVLLPNAGIWGTVAQVGDYPLDVFKRVIDINLTAVFSTMKLAIPHMIRRGGGSIVLTSSVAGVTGNAGTVAYTATKHAVIGIMRVAAVEYASAGIRVNTVNPGTIDTPMMRVLESTFSPEDPSQGATALKEGSLLKRYGTPEEVAGLMLYLASDESRYCTGGVYMIDGGMQHA